MCVGHCHIAKADIDDGCIPKHAGHIWCNDWGRNILSVRLSAEGKDFGSVQEWLLEGRANQGASCYSEVSNLPRNRRIETLTNMVQSVVRRE